jgi:hypothetical protein
MKKQSELSCDSKSSLQKVVAVLPRSCRKIIVWVCEVEGSTMWRLEGTDMAGRICDV